MYDEQKLAEIRQAKDLWEKTTLKEERQKNPERKKEFTTASGIPIKSIYTPQDLAEKGWDYMEKLRFPGEYPFTRGITATMSRSEFPRPFLYAGFGLPEQTNERFKWLIGQGAKDLCVALDLPTQIGYDSDNPLCRGEVGKIGVAINSVADMEVLLDGIPLEDNWMGTVGSAIAPIFLAWLLAIAEKRGIPQQRLRVAIQGDILREYVARGTQIFPLKPSVKLTCDYVEYCIKNGITFEQAYAGFHLREAGGTAPQEIGFTLANAAEYIREIVRRGISVDQLNQPRILITTCMDFFEEIAKHRALKRMYAKMMKEKFHAKNPQSMVFTFQIGNAKASLTAEQPLINVIRATIMSVAQALSGPQVDSASQYTEALSLPSPESVLLDMRVGELIAYESGIRDVVDPLAGSYYVEALTDELEKRATELFEQVEVMGGAIVAIERGFMQREIARSAYDQLRRIESGEKVWVGVNKFCTDERVSIQLQKVDPTVEEKQIQKLQKLKRERDNQKVRSSLEQLEEAAKEGVNLVPPILAAVKSYATIGEICDILRGVFGEYKATEAGLI